MYRILICLRYLRKKKITFFAIAGVALGVMALIYGLIGKGFVGKMMQV
ncbi:MAG: hypothetical protein ACUZ77_11585 [Candidatus Brocadiales bacterium]